MPKKSRKDKVKQVISYTKNERNVKVTKILCQLMQHNLDSALKEDVMAKINKFIENGEEYKDEVEVPEYSRVLMINLVNDKNKETYIKVSFKKIRVNDDEDNPINKLNKIQEEMTDL